MAEGVATLIPSKWSPVGDLIAGSDSLEAATYFGGYNMVVIFFFFMIIVYIGIHAPGSTENLSHSLSVSTTDVTSQLSLGGQVLARRSVISN